MKKIILAISLFLAACSSTQPQHFPTGTPTSAPYGYTEFCKREPDQCITPGEPEDNAKLDAGKPKDRQKNSEESQ